MATLKEMKDLAVYSAKGTAPENYTVESVNEALADGIRELAGSYNAFMKNRYDIYEIIATAADEIVPNKVISAMSPFAEVRVVSNGQKVMFKKGIGKNRAKKFLTQVGINGVYETFRLDAETFEIGTYSIGGGVTVDLQRMMDGAESLAEVMEVMTEGLTDAVFIEVQKALVASVNAVGRPAANIVSHNSFDGQKMMKLISTVKAYGAGAVIFAAPEFVAEMGADVIVPVSAGMPGIHPQDLDAIHNTGYINIFRGTPIVQIPQSFIDESNTKTWINPQFAYVLPTGKEKVVKVVLEGDSIVRDYQNRDGSMEIYLERKMGTAILAQYNWGIYQNTGITDTSESPYGI